MRYAAALVAALHAGVAFADDDFEKNIRPLLAGHCLKCHGPARQSGGLRLDSRDAILKGGDSGPAAVVGKPGESLLLKAVAYEGKPRMPPAGKLTERQITALEDWVRRGAPWPGAAAPPAPGGR